MGSAYFKLNPILWIVIDYNASIPSADETASIRSDFQKIDPKYCMKISHLDIDKMTFIPKKKGLYGYHNIQKHNRNYLYPKRQSFRLKLTYNRYLEVFKNTML